MAYISTEQVEEKRKLINQLCKKYGVSATVSGSNSIKITVTIRSGVIDFLDNHIETLRHDITNNQQHIENAKWYTNRGYLPVNRYRVKNSFSGIALIFMNELLDIVETGHYDNSDPMSEYFDVAWYIEITIGKLSKAYLLTK